MRRAALALVIVAGLGGCAAGDGNTAGLGPEGSGYMRAYGTALLIDLAVMVLRVAVMR